MLCFLSLLFSQRQTSVLPWANMWYCYIFPNGASLALVQSVLISSTILVSSIFLSLSPPVSSKRDHLQVERQNGSCHREIVLFEYFVDTSTKVKFVNQLFIHSRLMQLVVVSWELLTKARLNHSQLNTIEVYSVQWQSQ